MFHGGLSNQASDWSTFGSYLGGTLGPAFAFLAFILAMQNLRETRANKRLDGLLQSIQSYEHELKNILSLNVTCDSPWIWGQDFEATQDVEKLPLRTLLTSDGIDWETHLPELRNSLEFHEQESGDLLQDRDIWLKALNASEGLFAHLEAFEALDGAASLASFYRDSYEIPHNRLKATRWDADPLLGDY